MKKKLKGLLLAVATVAFASALAVPAMALADEAEGSGFADVEGDEWFADDVEWANESGLMTGTGDGTNFEPALGTTRAMFVTSLHRLEGEPAATKADARVPEGAWYTDAALWALEAGVLEGYDDGELGLSDPLTREQAAVFAHRYAAYKGYDLSEGEDTNILSYLDAGKFGSWAVPAVQWACGEGIILGYTGADGELTGFWGPKDPASRAMTAAILHRLVDNVLPDTGEEEPATPPVYVHYHSPSAWTLNGDGTHEVSCYCGAVLSEAQDCTYGGDSRCDYCDYVLVDEWDGTADTSWYNENETEFALTTAEQFAGFAKMVAVDSDNFEGKTIVLNADIDLALTDEDGKPVSFEPIGSTGERDDRNRLVTEPFEGTFDGNGHTISGLYQSGWAFGYEWGQYGSIGLFSELEGATVKNVVIEDFNCQVEGGDISFIAGSATGNCTFENIEIKSGSIGTYNNGIGGIIGWSGAGTYNFKDITIGKDVVIGGLWGSFDSSIGGIVGQAEPGATYNFENVDIACRIDAYNDCTASYDYYNYRMCGMIIGRLEETTTIDGTNYPDMSKCNITCNDVTVTYGDWANYHYCDPTPGYNNGRGMRVEPGYEYGGLPADYDHSQCTTHHNELIPFDQIFGGAQLGVKGLKTYEGVTVVYNNK